MLQLLWHWQYTVRLFGCDFRRCPRSRTGALNILNLHMQARGQPQNQQEETFHSAAQIYTSNACAETTSGWSFKVRRWRAECCHWFCCRAVNAEVACSCCRGYSHVSFTLHLSALLFRWRGNEHKSWSCWFNHFQVLTAAPVWLWGELRAPLRLLPTFVCGVSVIH